jgi:hypothetical protein
MEGNMSRLGISYGPSGCWRAVTPIANCEMERKAGDENGGFYNFAGNRKTKAGVG